MARKRKVSDRRLPKREVRMVTVLYTGRADQYINFPTREQPEGFSFERGIPVDVPAALWPRIEATGLFERVRPDPKPVALPSLPDTAVGALPAEEWEGPPSTDVQEVPPSESPATENEEK